MDIKAGQIWRSKHTLNHWTVTLVDKEYGEVHCTLVATPDIRAALGRTAILNLRGLQTTWNFNPMWRMTRT